MRNKICIVIPTRARPVAQAEALASILGNSAGYADVVFAVDPDDAACLVINGPKVATRVMPQRGPMLHALNHVIQDLLPHYPIFGFSGDDVRYETPNWDVKVWNTLKTQVGVLYGEDGIQHENLPTHPWFSAEIVKALGYVAPPCLRHYCFDSFLKKLTKEMGLLHWEPALVTRHLHHSVKGLSYDAVYRQAERVYQDDRQAFQHYCQTDLETDKRHLVELLKKLALLPAQL